MRFLLIDRITSWKIGASATAIKNVSLSEDYFADHFPEMPIMPGALILEGMAQLAGLLLEETATQSSGIRVKALMSIIEKAKFRAPVRPGDQLQYTAHIVSINEASGKASAKAMSGGKVCAECRFVFIFQEFQNPRLEFQQQEIVKLWMEGCE